MQPNNLTGYLLISPPGIPDRRFANTVIYISSHTPAGAWGMALNRPIDHVSVREVMDKLNYPVGLEGVVHAGGPVDHTIVHFLHSNDVMTGNTIMDERGICTSGDTDFIQLLLNGHKPEKCRVFLGACTWAPGQLENELFGEKPYSTEHSWLIAPPIPSVVFEFDGLEQWHAAVDLAARSAVSEWMV